MICITRREIQEVALFPFIRYNKMKAQQSACKQATLDIPVLLNQYQASVRNREPCKLAGNSSDFASSRRKRHNKIAIFFSVISHATLLLNTAFGIMNT